MAALAALLGLLLAAGGAYWQGRQDGRDAAEALAAREQRLVAAAADHAASAAADAIARIKVRHTTIRQEAEREIQTRVEYRDCRHSADQLQRLNAAIAGADGPGAVGGGELPASGAAR
jgi:uncharacterized protein HemX